MFSNKILSQKNIKQKILNQISKNYINDDDFFWLFLMFML